MMLHLSFNCLKMRLREFKLVGLLAIGFSAMPTHAQNRVDLEDLSVKGELLNDNRMRMTAREATRIQDRIHYRKNFRPEILDEQELRMPAAEEESP